jgi:hypothetical protein
MGFEVQIPLQNRLVRVAKSPERSGCLSILMY